MMQPPAGMTPPGGINWMPSPIEAKFQEIDNPFDIPQPPTTDNLVQFGYNFFGNPSSVSPQSRISRSATTT